MTAEERNNIALQLRMIMNKLAAIEAEINRLIQHENKIASCEEPKIADTARMGIVKAARLLGISRDTLRCHTDNNYIRCDFSRGNKRKVYKGADLKRYWRTYL